MVNIDKTVLTF